MHERRRISRRRAELEKEERCGVNNKWSKFKIKLVHLNKLINSKRGEEVRDEVEGGAAASK